MATSPPPEAQLIEDARKRRGLSQNRAGVLAEITGNRWRQLVGGTWPTDTPKVAMTVAKMARTVGVSVDAMRETGRHDVAAAMEGLAQAEAEEAKAAEEARHRTAPETDAEPAARHAHPGEESGHIRGWPLRANEELRWEPQDPNLPGSPAIRYVYTWRDPDNPDDYIESSKGMDPSRDPLEVAQLFREMLAEVHGSRILGNPERTPRG